MSSQDALAAAHSSWNAGDLDGYLRLYDETIRLHGYCRSPWTRTRCAGAAVFSAFDSPQLEFHEVRWDGGALACRRPEALTEEAFGAVEALAHSPHEFAAWARLRGAAAVSSSA
jgi:hypothetical protein